MDKLNSSKIQRWFFNAFHVLFEFTARVLNKLKINMFNNALEKVTIKCAALAFSDTKLASVIQDKGHKLLQQALGQQIDNNQYFLSTMIEEADKRKIDNETIRWAKDIYNDFLNGRIYEKHSRAIDDSQENLTLDSDQLDNYFKLVHKRQSLRTLRPPRIPEEIVEKILKCGIEAPSSCNRQSWRFITLTNEADKQFIAKIRNIKFIEKAPLVILALVNTEVYYNKLDKDITSIMDVSASIMNILNACTACGLGSCWINYKASVSANNTKLLKQRFKIDKKYDPMSIIIVGKSTHDIKKPWRNEIRDYWLASY